MIDETALIHPMALVTDSDIGKHAKVWQFASVIRGAIIGDGCTVSSTALIDGSYIGDGSIVGQSVIMGPGFYIGKNCFLGPNVVLCNDTWPRAEKSHFAGYICATAFPNNEERKKHASIVIEDGVSIGANATILPGIVLGSGAMIAAGATVGMNVPSKCLYHRDGRISPITDELETIRVETRCRRALRHLPVLDAEPV